MKFKIVLLAVLICVFVVMAINYMHAQLTDEQILEPTETKNNEDINTTSTTVNSVPTESTTVVEPTVEPTIEPTIEPTVNATDGTAEETKNEDDTNLISLGEFRLTAYCSCGKCCGKWAENRPVDENGNEIVYGSMGVPLVAGLSVAVDTNVIPYGTEIVINGHTYIAQDTGSGIVDKCIDVYFDNHEEALNFGMQYAEVFLKEN